MTALCIGPFNYFGLFITKHSSALERCLVCTGRMVLVWIGSLCCSWESFSALQFFGYFILTFGIYKFSQISNRAENIIEED